MSDDGVATAKPVFKKRKRKATGVARARLAADDATADSPTDANNDSSAANVSPEADSDAAADARLLKEARAQARRRRRGLGAASANDAALLPGKFNVIPLVFLVWLVVCVCLFVVVE